MEEGFKERFKEFTDWLEGEIKRLLDLIEQLTGESSPSKITDKIGYYLAAGMGIGFERGMKGVRDTIGKAMGETMDGAWPKLPEIDAENMQEVANALLAALDVMARLATYQMPDLSRIQAFIEDWNDLLWLLIGTEQRPGIFRTDWGLDPERIQNVTNVMAAVESAIDAIDRLNGYVPRDLSNLGAFADQMHSVILELRDAINSIAGWLPNEEQVNVVTSMLDLVGNAVKALADLNAWVPGSLANLPEFVSQVGATVQAINDALSGLDLAEADITGASVMMEFVTKAAEGLSALSGYTPATLHLTEFASDIADTINALADAFSGLDQEALDAAALWADSAGQLLGIVDDGIDALIAIADYTSPANLGELSVALGRDLATATVGMVKGFQYADDLSQEALDAAAAWAEGAGKILDTVESAVGGITALQFYTRPGNLAAQAAMLGHDTAIVVQALMDAFPVEMDAARITAVGDALQAAADGVLKTLDALWSIGSYQGGIGAGLSAFISDLQLLINMLGELDGALPPWLRPGSPPPLAYALQDIAHNAMAATAAMYPLAAAPITNNRVSISLNMPTTIGAPVDLAALTIAVSAGIRKGIRYGLS